MHFLDRISKPSREQNPDGINADFRGLFGIHRELVQQVDVSPSVTTYLGTNVFSYRGSAQGTAPRISRVTLLKRHPIDLPLLCNGAALTTDRNRPFSGSLRSERDPARDTL